MTVRELIIKLKYDTDKKSLNRGLQRLKKFKMVAKRLALGAVVAVGAIGIAAIKTASEMEEAGNKFDVVFQGLGKEANKAKKELVDFYGMSKLEATKALGTFQDFLVPMGIARDKGLELSHAFNKMAVDLGSFNDVPTEDALNAIKSALVGMSRPLLNYGVDVSAATLKSIAQERGIALVNGKLDRQTRAMLILERIQKDSKDAMGDFIRTTKSFANQMKIAKARITDMMGALGSTILPFATKILIKLTGVLENSLMPILQKVLGFLVPVFDKVVDVFDEVLKALIPIVDTIVSELTPVVNDLLGFLLTAFKILLPLIESFLRFFVDTNAVITKLIMSALKPLFSILIFIFKFLSPILTTVLNLLDQLITDGFGELFLVLDEVAKLFDEAFGDLFEMLSPVFKILMWINKIIFKILIVTNKWLFKILGKGLKQTLIPLKVILKVFRIYNKVITTLAKIIGGLLLVAFKKVWKFAKVLFDPIIKAVKWLVKIITNKLTPVMKVIQDVWTNIFNSIEKVMVRIKSGITGLVDDVMNKVNMIIDKLNKLPGVDIEKMGSGEKGSPTPNQTRYGNNGGGNTNNNNISVNPTVNIIGDIKNKEAMKQTLQKSAQAVFNIELQKILINSGY